MATIIPFGLFRGNSQPDVLSSGHRATVIRFPGRAPAPAAPAAKVQPKQRKRGRSSKEEQRNGLLAKIHIALNELYKKLPHFDEEFYRDELDRRFNLTERKKGKSAAELTMPELEEVKLWLASLGWKSRKGRHRKEAPAELTHDSSGMSREEQMGKIEAMLAEKGRAEGTDVPWGYAVTILKNKSRGKVTSFKDAKPEHLDMVIAALYNDARRKGRRVR